MRQDGGEVSLPVTADTTKVQMMMRDFILKGWKLDVCDILNRCELSISNLDESEAIEIGTYRSVKTVQDSRCRVVRVAGVGGC